MSTSSFVFFSTNPDDETLPILRDLLLADETHAALLVASTLDEAVTADADVLILHLADDLPTDVSEELLQRLQERKVIGIGYAAAELFGQLGLEINGGACAHYGTVAPKILVEKNELLPTVSFGYPFRPLQLSPKAMNLDHFAMHIPRHSELLTAVDVVARTINDENYAPIVRQGNFVLIGLVAPPEIWSPEYKELFQKIAFALQVREAQPFRRARWEISLPGTQDFALAEGFSTKAASGKKFYFRFSKPTTFSATLRHKGSNNMMLLFMGDRNREHWTREDAGEGEDLEIHIDITEDDLQNIGDWYWYLQVTNFDTEHTAECSLTVEYEE